MLEIIVYNGKKTTMNPCSPMPENDPRVPSVDDWKISLGNHFGSMLNRRYIGEWEIKDHKLYLTNVKGRYKLLSSKPILADWFSGLLRIHNCNEPIVPPEGITLYTTYKEEIHVTIDKGIVIETKHMKFKQ